MLLMMAVYKLRLRTVKLPTSAPCAPAAAREIQNLHLGCQASESVIVIFDAEHFELREAASMCSGLGSDPSQNAALAGQPALHKWWDKQEKNCGLDDEPTGCNQDLLCNNILRAIGFVL